MGKTRIMVIHPGHTHSTSDVFDGLCAGLRMNDVEVVPFTWDKTVQIMTALALGAQAGGVVRPNQSEKLHQFLSWLASADAISVAIDQEVEAFIVVNGTLFPPSRAALLKKIGLPVACIGTEAPYFLRIEKELAPFYSHWFTNERKCVGMFDAPTTYLRHAYNPELHQPGAVDDTKRVPAVFVGGGYPERKQVINGARALGAEITTHGTLWHLDLTTEVGMRDLERGARYTEGVIPNSETAAWHRSATIALNLHRRMGEIEVGDTVDPALLSSLGPRAYEIPAVGGFMLCDDERSEIHEVYGDAAATFRAWDSADLARQLHYWLANDERRERARAAQQAAVQEHHWGNRAKDVLERLFN